MICRLTVSEHDIPGPGMFELLPRYHIPVTRMMTYEVLQIAPNNANACPTYLGCDLFGKLNYLQKVLHGLVCSQGRICVFADIPLNTEACQSLQNNDREKSCIRGGVNVFGLTTMLTARRVMACS